MNRKILAPLLSILLLAGVGVAIYFSASEQFAIRQQQEIRGLVGSEKMPFFTDPEVIAALAKHGMKVAVEKAGSRQIALRKDIKEYDFVFPAGVPAAEKIKREHQVHQAHTIFFTPMAIASWKIIAEILEDNGIVQKHDNIHYIINMEALLTKIVDETRWSMLKNSEKYAVNKGVLITSTDIRQSNSAAMYLSLASFVLNGHDILTSEDQVQRLLPRLSALFLRQGYVESSSAGPYDDYLVMGPGKAPLVMIYEAQFLHDAARQKGVINSDMVLLYPEPTVFTKHILLPLSKAGEQLAEILSNDPDMQLLEIKHGFRNKNTQAFKDFVDKNNLAVPANLYKVVEPPSYEILEHTIQQIEEKYQQQM